jgi:rhodanese-related sulfurtransferase
LSDRFLIRISFEFKVESIPGAVNIPLGKFRSRLHELPADREIQVMCRWGQRAYMATRILLQNGFKAKNAAGGMLSFAQNQLMNFTNDSI